jgi:hypothetical protein
MPVLHRRCGEAVDPVPYQNVQGDTLYWCPQCVGHVWEQEVWQEPLDDAPEEEL